MQFDKTSLIKGVALVIVTTCISYTLYMSLVRNELIEPRFWQTMKVPVVLGVVLGVWTCGWESWQGKGLMSLLVAKAAGWFGIAAWGYFYIRVAVLANAKVPAVLLPPHYCVLAVAIVLIVLAATYWKERERGKAHGNE